MKRSHEYGESGGSHHKSSKMIKSEEPRFTFEEVKTMIEELLSKQTRASAAVSAGLKRVNFEEIAVEGHSVQSCRELIEQLVQNTRRVRTLQEVLLDIKDNLNKRAYTEIIHRASVKGDLPKKPPSAYLLYHQDRYNELRSENALAVEVSKIVAEEWKTLNEKKRREYQKRHDELVRRYEKEMKRLGLVDKAAPKRPKSAKTLYVDDKLSEWDTTNWSKDMISVKRDELGQEFDSLSAEEKQGWIQLHKENQERYIQEKQEYIEAHPHLNHSVPEKKQRANEKVLLPRLPKSALKFFLEKKTEGLEGVELEETKKRLKEKFTRLKEKKLLKYIKKAIQDKERYEREVAEFKEKHPGREVPKIKANITKDQLKLFAKVVENRPTLPAPTSYLHYCSKMLTDMYDNDDDIQAPTKRMQTASVAWKECSPKEKRQAEKEHVADIERYICEMEAWLASRPEERRLQVLSEEPKANPDYWKKKLNRIKKAEKKRE